MATRNTSQSAAGSVLSLAGTLFGIIGGLTVLNTVMDLNLRIMRQALPKDNVTGIVLLAVGILLYSAGHFLFRKKS
jgi:hypothetical protein